ncbi:Sporulation kinase D [Pirellulimonas nuda]|uniref:histidine kinase n=1 Tax=Pirellulimonas nuda TaxID=2528009 RepID=A0A518DG57_9BACT|nr:ATP-binding protein [Pirellulimonas nuda]QDU90460.1 Sporulation kinase D [Pirellulimonas nuda]
MVPLLAVALASLTAIALINARAATLATKSRIERQLQDVVRVLAGSSFPLTDSVLAQMGGLAEAQFVLTDASGRRLASSLAVGPDVFDAGNHAARRINQVKLGDSIELDGLGYYHSAVAIKGRTPFPGPTVLHILFPHDDYNAAWRTVFLPPLLVGLATALSVAIVTHLVTTRISRALGRLGREVQTLAGGDFSKIPTPRLNDETRDLTIAVNHTATRLADFEAEVRQTEQMRTLAMLGAGLAHEMRNAATGCRLAVDLHAEGCRSEQGVESLSVARRQLDLMEHRLNRFLKIGRQPAEEARRDVNLADLVAEMTSLVAPAARHAGVRLRQRRLGDPAVVSADAELLGQAVMNLLLNALDAASGRPSDSDRAGVVRVLTWGDRRQSRIVVTDSGPGPQPGVGDRVFAPFVTDKPEGVGLGLSVARRIVESYGGQIEWIRRGRRTRFLILLPVAGPPTPEPGTARG